MTVYCFIFLSSFGLRNGPVKSNLYWEAGENINIIQAFYVLRSCPISNI